MLEMSTSPSHAAGSLKPTRQSPPRPKERALSQRHLWSSLEEDLLR